MEKNAEFWRGKMKIWGGGMKIFGGKMEILGGLEERSGVVGVALGESANQKEGAWFGEDDTRGSAAVVGVA